MAPKRFDPKAKARKQKIVAAVLGVLFLGVMVYQAPTILGLFGGGSSEVATEPAPPPPPAAAAPAPGVATPAAAPATGSAELVDTDVVAEPTQGQLVTFDRFESKDPFAQQAEENTGESAPAAETAPPKDTGLSEGPGDWTTESTPPPPAKAESATISVNGVSTQASVGGTFPEDDPIFKLVSLTKRSAKVGIVDGTYATGSATITLTKGGKPVTLMNTADGTTYVLRLVSVG
jgi:hypothetical protein